MKSMTGYGIARTQNNDIIVEVSLRAVNGRFLETRFHLPRLYYAVESDLKKKLSHHAVRGTVDIYVSRKIKSDGHEAQIKINTKLALDYAKSFTKLAKDLKMKEPIKLEQILRQNDIIHLEEKEGVGPQEIQLLKKTFEAAFKKFLDEKVREGQALKKDLHKNLKDLQKHVQKISKLRDEANKVLQEKFEARIKSRLPKEVITGSVDQQRLTQEIVIQLDKADINEEVIRLTEHLKNFERLMEDSVVEGKKLDFYTQELLREVNTIGSKSQVAGITEAVVEAKTLIERIKEQVQNIE